MKVVSIILAGGKGTRLFPVTLEIPKPLVEFQGKKLVDYSLEVAVSVSDKVIITTHYKADLIEGYIKNNWPGVICIKEDRILGTGGSLRSQLDLLRSMKPETILLLMADHVRGIDMEKFIHYHIDSGHDLTVLASGSSLEHDLLSVENGLVVDFVDKGKLPEANSYSCIGEYIFFGEFLCRELAKKEVDTPFNLGDDFVKPIIKNGSSKVGMFCIERWDDIGTLDKIIC